MGRCLARPHATRPGPAHENSLAASWAGQSGQYIAHTSWATARPGPSNLQSMGKSNLNFKGRGPARLFKFIDAGQRPAQPIACSVLPAQPSPARPIPFSKNSARPRPAHHTCCFVDPFRPSPLTFSNISARPWPGPS